MQHSGFFHHIFSNILRLFKDAEKKTIFIAESPSSALHPVACCGTVFVDASCTDYASRISQRMRAMEHNSLLKKSKFTGRSKSALLQRLQGNEKIQASQTDPKGAEGVTVAEERGVRASRATLY